MAASFWQSSHYNHWLMKKDKLEALQEPARRKDREQGGFKDEQLRQLRIYYAELVSQLGRLLKLRQRVIATAQVFLKRFYLKNSLLDFDPNLVVPTCLYLAAKVEECTTPGRVFDAGMRRLLGPEEFPYETRHILECEFYLLEELSFQLVVYHPYRPLAHFLASQPALGDLLEPAHAIVNDSYRTDASLMYPPYVIALAAIYLAACARERDVRQWFAELNVDMNEISKLVAQLLDLYELWPQTAFLVLGATRHEQLLARRQLLRVESQYSRMRVAATVHNLFILLSSNNM